ncbi:MAG TPA: hypothetical protein PL131_11780 [Methylotenera sp.]|nr:hypothetical protein [Methylotenera sp.]HPH06546.1 hypothetical protein [Methylotenera sp.]HPN01804.1 hypothetical protein [Methylotenera sp.]
MQSLIHYRIRWKPAGNQPGSKRGQSAGMGDQLRALVLLRDHPDPRRLDLRTSLRDPFERLWVRDFYLNTALNVIVLVDASASMAYVGRSNRMAVAQDISAQLALSAYRSGDAFGVYLANQNILKNGVLPPRMNRSAYWWVKQHFAQIAPSGENADGLLQVAAQLSKRRSLVFVVSDFRWEAGKLKALLKTLRHHDVVPLVLRDPAEYDAMPTSGIATLQDAETGATRFVWMRNGLIEKVRNARLAHWGQIDATCRTYGCKPLLVHGEFENAQLTRYFMERMA